MGKNQKMSLDYFSYNSMAEFFNVMNNHEIKYVVLRNYDNLLTEEMYMEGHGDVDILCENSELLEQKLHIYPDSYHKKNGISDKVHYHFYINGIKVSLDTRFLGDDYYCERWEEEILERRVMHENFYVMNSNDHFYSLVYHAIFQKSKLSEEYRNRLTVMAKNLDIKLPKNDSQNLVRILEDYMKCNNYKYVFPKDKLVPFKFSNVNDFTLLEIKFKEMFQHVTYNLKIEIISCLVKIKHFIKL